MIQQQGASVLWLQADEHTYTTLIKTLSYAGKVDDALQVRFFSTLSLCSAASGRKLPADNYAAYIRQCYRLMTPCMDVSTFLHASLAIFVRSFLCATPYLNVHAYVYKCMSVTLMHTSTMPICQHCFLPARHLHSHPQTHAQMRVLGMQITVCGQVQQMMMAANFEPTDMHICVLWECKSVYAFRSSK